MSLEKVLSQHLNISEDKAKDLLLDLERVSWVYSSSSVKRAFGIWGNAIAAYFMVIIPIIVFSIFLGLVT